ncbi:response regulator transcription factor [Streptomyces sp. NPDC053560]|uniref:response regulator transcription factor n=1 Tax=Streptomyces sp. NPDC053560 TaxID=3365711 RepID=UPI0037D8E69D
MRAFGCGCPAHRTSEPSGGSGGPTRSPTTVEQRSAYTRVAVLSRGPCPPYDVVAVVLLSPPGELYGLTRRELQIVGLVVEGCTNQRIASTLHIAERTVAAHIEHVLPEPGAVCRTQIAVRALARGLYLPSPARLGAGAAGGT